MSTLKTLIRALAPNLLVQINDAKKQFSSISTSPWRDACSADKRLALAQSRLSILPPTFTRSPSFVIDIGANEGQWIDSLTKLLPIPDLWVFEPNPEAMKVCQERLGKRPGITYFDMALGEADGQIELHVTSSSDFASVLQPRTDFLKAHYGENAAHVATTLQVPLRALDALVPESRSVDLLKIDVQGYERAVLSGARRVLARTRTVLIEANLQSHYAGDAIFPALWSDLADQGFSFWSLSAPHAGQGGKALWADAVFIRGDGIQ